jgi:hypothetical protein
MLCGSARRLSQHAAGMREVATSSAGSRRHGAKVSIVTADGEGFTMLAHLLEASHLATMEQLPGLVSHHSAAIGLSDITILIPDLRQKSLVALPPP